MPGPRDGVPPPTAGTPPTDRRAPLRVPGAETTLAPMAIRVALAEDSFLIREALTQLVRDEPGFELVAVCSDGDELRARLAEDSVDVVVTDIRMPPSMGDEGVRIATELHRSDPEVGVVLLSAYCDAALAVELLATGSDRRGYLLKERVHSGRQLTTTIKAVARGASAIDPKVIESLMEARERRERSPVGRLSEIEREVLVAMARGASNAAIADELGLTKRGVEKHINGIFAKLALSSAGDVSRRVTAVLTYLTDVGRPPPAPEPAASAVRRPRRGTAARP